MEKHKIDVTDPIRFPDESKKWKAYLVKLVKEGRSETTHHSEVDPVTMELIYRLLFNVKNALVARGTPEFDEMIEKMPKNLQNKLHRVLQWGAQLLLMLFEARRGAKGMPHLKKNDFVIYEDPIKKFRKVILLAQGT